jgi:hypothetical protein
MKTEHGLRLLPDTTAQPRPPQKRSNKARGLIAAAGLTGVALLGAGGHAVMQGNEVPNSEPACAVPISVAEGHGTVSAIYTDTEGVGSSDIWGYDGTKPIERASPLSARAGDEVVIEHVNPQICVQVGGQVLQSMQNAQVELAPVLSGKVHRS